MAKYLDKTGLDLLVNNYLKPETEYSLTSVHPVQNKVLTQTLGNLLSIIDYSKSTGYFHYANAAALPTVNSTGQEEGDFEYNPEKELKIGQRAILDDTQVIMEISAIDSETGAITWIDTGLSFAGQVIQVDELPTASAAEEGKIYQYIGETNLSFTNGRFYRCVSDGEASPSYNWEEVDFGDSTPHWTGTQAEYNAAASGIEDGTIVNITDDYQEGVEVVDIVEDGNMNAVTSNAVAGLVEPVVGAPVPYSGNVSVATPETFTNFVRSGNVVTVSLYFKFNTGALAGNDQILFTGLPKPKRPILFVLSTNTQDASIKEKSCVVQLNTDGNILTSFIPTHIGTSAHVCGAFSYVTED